MEFNRKNKEKVYKEDNPLLILADNVNFDMLMERRHPARYSHDVMATRVESLELRSRATLHFLLDRCLVVTVEDGLAYFSKVIKEYLGKDKNIIKKYAKRDDAIGR